MAHMSKYGGMRMTEETVVYDAQTGREEIKEIEETIEKPETPPEPSLEEKVQELQEENAMLTACILEMSELVYK